MINKINKWNLGEIREINQEVHQRDWEIMRFMVRSRVTLKLKKRGLNRDHLGI